MSITTLEYDCLQSSFAVCKVLLNDLQPRLSELQHIYDSAGGVKETLTQEELDEVAVFSGLTKQQVDDGMYALTTLILPAITQSYAAMAQLAARSRGTMLPPPMPLAPITTR